jgi:phosphatidate phosphatase PAH1
MQTWDGKGYTIVYLTARLHTFRPETRTWLEDEGYPTGPMITAADLGDAAAYKTAWLQRMIDDFGWDVVAAYGNATTDIDAYAAAGIPTDITFIIGPNAGMGGTQPIANDDYTQHIADFVDQQPDNN